MKKQILFIHSAGPQGMHEGSSDLIAYLQKNLGDKCNLLYPEMPDPEDPKYRPWKEQLEREIALLDNEVILIGHSLGAAVLLKYLSEEKFRPSISGLFLIASPYWGKDNDWQFEEFTLADNFTENLPKISQLVIYHSRNDEIVPFAHLEHYAKALPQAVTHVVEGADHAFSSGLPELVDDIKHMTTLKKR
ncbi:RBBP9/YdeN family alpha/beta hydrolase [Virgibacillus doumboii]|uniref:RBBP9/YdeN family alpha/beta hydrolase n=1 Tax=Virgibacillus doumboii TaxID=2697503 RepID=UPI0013DE9BF5|nr:alpha/beta hydrolase [Virgibacillus doumboii]